jgi:hypothetical protein
VQECSRSIDDAAEMAPHHHSHGFSGLVSDIGGAASTVGRWGMNTGRVLQNAGIDALNASASVGNAIIEHPGDTGLLIAGLTVAAAGSGVEGFGVALDVTGVGAIAGVPLNVLGAGLITAGGATAIKAGADLGHHAATDSRITTVHNKADGGPASKATNASKLREQLAQESAHSAFLPSGELSPAAIADATQIAPGDTLGNEALVSALTEDGSRISDWAKYSTRTFQSPSGDFQVHFYKNQVTGTVNYDFDFKIKLNRPGS